MDFPKFSSQKTWHLSSDIFLRFSDNSAIITTGSNAYIWIIKDLQSIEFGYCWQKQMKYIKIYGEDHSFYYEVAENHLCVIDMNRDVSKLDHIAYTIPVVNSNILENIMRILIEHDKFYVDYENGHIAYSWHGWNVDDRLVCITSFRNLMFPVKKGLSWEVYDMLSSSYKVIRFSKKDGRMLPDNISNELAVVIKNICMKNNPLLIRK